MSPRSEIEAVLSIKLPKDSSDFHFRRITPSTDLALSFAYIKFRCSEASYLSMVKEMGLQSVEAAGGSLAYPIADGDWKLPSSAPALPWWDIGPDIPPTAASQSFLDGNIVIKHENGYVYAVKVSGLVR